MTFQHKQQLRSCPRGTTASRSRLPLQEAPPPKKGDFLPDESTPPKENPPFWPDELKSSKKNPLFPFPRWTDPIPDALIDYTELWKVVSVAKPLPDAAKSNQVGSKGGSSEGTTAYDDLLYRLGIDIETTTGVGKPEDVNVDGLPPQPTVQYSHLSTHEQLYALAEQHKRYYGRKLNEATLAARLMSNLFIFADVPDPDDPDRTVVPCQTFELAGEFTDFDRFDKSLYSYVRGPRPRSVQPYESELRYRSDLTIMAYNNAVSCDLREFSRDFPGVYSSYDAVAPFFSAEFKPDDSPANKREATHQIAISSYINLVERQRLRRLH
jgi:hypothetical protein